MSTTTKTQTPPDSTHSTKWPDGLARPKPGDELARLEVYRVGHGRPHVPEGSGYEETITLKGATERYQLSRHAAQKLREMDAGESIAPIRVTGADRFVRLKVA